MGRRRGKVGSLEEHRYGELVGDQYIFASIAMVITELLATAGTPLCDKRTVNAQLDFAEAEANRMESRTNRAAAMTYIEENASKIWALFNAQKKIAS
jgi:hypothetical protein